MEKGDWLWLAYGAVGLVVAVLAFLAGEKERHKKIRERLRDKEW